MHGTSLSLPLPVSQIDFRCTLRDGTLGVETVGPGVGQSFRILLRVEAPTRFEASVRRGPAEEGFDVEPFLGHWAMSPGRLGATDAGDVFASLIAEVDSNVRELAGALEHPWRGYGLALGTYRALVRDAARAAIAACDPDALMTARRFPTCARWNVYSAIADDQTGRMRQLAATCPGVVLLVAALGQRGHADAANAILRAAVRGRRLRDVVAEAVAAWEETRRRDDVEREWPSRSAGGWERDLRAQPILIRRAGTQVLPEHLLVRPIPRFAPEDIPSRPDRNAAWFRVAAGASRALARAGDLGIALSPFISRHAHALLKAARRQPEQFGDDLGPGDDVHHLVERLIGYCRETGRRPGRRSHAVEILDELRRWEHVGSPAARLGRLLKQVQGLDLGPVVAVEALTPDLELAGVEGLALPPWPYPDVSVPDVRATPLGSIADLATEGAFMRSCVASLLPDVLAGGLHVFSLRVGGARLTAAVRRGLLEYELEELRGVDNRLPLPPERAAVSCWLEAINDRCRS